MKKPNIHSSIRKALKGRTYYINKADYRLSYQKLKEIVNANQRVRYHTKVLEEEGKKYNPKFTIPKMTVKIANITPKMRLGKLRKLEAQQKWLQAQKKLAQGKLKTITVEETVYTQESVIDYFKHIDHANFRLDLVELYRQNLLQCLDTMFGTAIVDDLLIDVVSAITHLDAWQIHELSKDDGRLQNVLKFIYYDPNALKDKLHDLINEINKFLPKEKHIVLDENAWGYIQHATASMPNTKALDF
jgi:hypothetical protein